MIRKRWIEKQGSMHMSHIAAWSVAAWVVVLGINGFAQNTGDDTGPHLYETPQEKRDIAGITLMEGVSVGVLVEAEVSAGEEDNEAFSDIVLATFELAVDAELSDWISGHALLLWEEDDTEPIDLDEATITLGGTEAMPFLLTGGKLYVPFGMFNSHLVSDPITLELGETRESAVLLGYVQGMIEIQIGVFNGDLNKDGDDDHADDMVASVILSPIERLSFGVSWISDIGESDGLAEGLGEAVEGAEDRVVVGPDDNPAVEPGTPGIPYEEVGGISGFMCLELGPVTIDGEFIAAVEEFPPGLLGEEALQPAAWNAEVAFCLAETCDAELALRYEGSDELPGFPEWQCGVAGSMRIAKDTTVAVEFMHGEFDEDTDDRNVATAQLAVKF